MAGRPTREKDVNQDDSVKRAYGIMADIRAKLYRRLANYVLDNEGRIRAEALGAESYSFCLQQMEDQFLNRLNVVERAVAELARNDTGEPTATTTTYETVEVIAKRDELPQKIADALAEHGESDFLDMSVLVADETHAEVLLVLAREEPAPALEAQALTTPAAGNDRDEESDQDDAT